MYSAPLNAPCTYCYTSHLSLLTATFRSVCRVCLTYAHPSQTVINTNPLHNPPAYPRNIIYDRSYTHAHDWCS
jgi:hypothetical protein